VNQYKSRCVEILLDLKSKTDILDVNIQLQLTDAYVAVYTNMEEAARIRITREIKRKTQALTLRTPSITTTTTPPKQADQGHQTRINMHETRTLNRNPQQ
jgi:hypothetical protein